LGLLAALRFGCGIGAGLGFALLGGALVGGSSGVGFFFSLLLDCHYAGFFGRLDGFASGGLDGFFVAPAAIGIFSSLQLLIRLSKSSRSVLVRACVARDAHGIAGFKEFERRVAVDAEDGVLDLSVRGRINTTGEEFVPGVDVFDSGST